MTFFIVRIAHVDALHQSRLAFACARLQQIGLSVVHLNGVRAGIHQHLDHARHMFQAVHERRLITDPVVNRDIKTAAIVQQTIQADFFGDIHVDSFLSCVASSAHADTALNFMK